VIAWAVADAFGMATIPVPEDATRTTAIGTAIFTNWVIPFEAMSFVLLAALIGGIAIARRDDPVKEDV
jgi:NADH-quinone oxidoreductase subunit J